MNRFLISISNSAVSAILIVLLSWTLSPAAFGELTYTRSIVLFCVTALFDWLCLSVIRYWAGESDGRAARQSTLEGLIGWTVLAIPPLGLVGYAVAGAGVSPAMLLAIVIHVVALGYAESRVAIARSDCDDRDLGMMILPRAASTLAFAAAAVLAGAQALGVLAALAAAQCSSILYLVVARRPFHVALRRPDGALTMKFLRFGGASVVADAANAGGALALATMAVASHGASTYGGYALVNELLTRTVSAAGFALELALLPLALLAMAERGRAAGLAVLSKNIGFSIAALAPMLVGFFLVAPAFAQVALSPDQRDSFVALAGWVTLQCVFTTGRQFILNQPLFAAERTAPIVWCMLAGVLTSVAMGWLLIPRHGAIGIAWAQTGGAAVTFALQAVVVGLVFPAFPSWRAAAAIVAGCAAMAAALWPWRTLLSGAPGLVAMMAAGAAVYAAVLWLLDFEGVRSTKSLRAIGRTQAQSS